VLCRLRLPPINLLSLLSFFAARSHSGNVLAFCKGDWKKAAAKNSLDAQ
jgi:hypothetical protein